MGETLPRTPHRPTTPPDPTATTPAHLQAGSTCTSGAARPRIYGGLDALPSALFYVGIVDPTNMDDAGNTAALTLTNVIVDGLVTRPEDGSRYRLRGCVIGLRGGGVVASGTDFVNCQVRRDHTRGPSGSLAPAGGRKGQPAYVVQSRGERTGRAAAGPCGALSADRLRPTHEHSTHARGPPTAAVPQGVNDYGGGAVSVEDTPFIMSNGRIEGAFTSGSGGAIRAEAATINMTR